MQCLMPCRSQSCQRQQKNYNCCNDCMEDMEGYDDYKKRRKRNTMFDFENRLQKKCYNLLIEKSNKRQMYHQELNNNYNRYMPEGCHACNHEQYLR